MKTKKRDTEGFSLVELLITMVISGVMVVAIGMIIIYANESWVRATKVSEVFQGSRAGKKTVEFQARGAITMPLGFSVSATEPVTIPAGEAFLIQPGPGGGHKVTFNVSDRRTNKYKLNTFRFDDINKVIKYDYTYADTNAWGNPTYYLQPTTTMEIIRDAISMNVTAVDFGPTTTIEVTVVQERNLVQDGTQKVNSTTKFRIKTRNLIKP